MVRHAFATAFLFLMLDLVIDKTGTTLETFN